MWDGPGYGEVSMGTTSCPLEPPLCPGSHCPAMLRCLLQRATHLPNLEKGDKQSDPVASLTFRGEAIPDLGWDGQE